MLAIGVNFSGGTLTIQGTTAADVIAVSHIAVLGVEYVLVTEAGTVAWDGSIQATPVRTSDVTSIDVYGNDSGDTISLADVLESNGYSGLDGDIFVDSGNDESGDTVTGSEFGDEIEGSYGNDSLAGGHGPDTISGFDGDDQINTDGRLTTYPQTGPISYLYGGNGNDNITASGSRTVAYGGEGDDVIFFYQSYDDSLYGGPGGDILVGGLGDDWLFTNSDDVNETDHAFGAHGNDTLVAGTGLDRLWGNYGNIEELFEDYNAPAPLEHHTDRDSLVGGTGAESVWSMFGEWDDDTLIAGTGGGGVMYGMIGDDSMVGGGLRDTMYGGSGFDTLLGGDLGDDLFGEGDDDTILGGDGADSIDAGDGWDTVYGGSGRDTIYGREGNDTLYGEEDDDTIYGGTDRDSIFGGMDNDSIAGEDGNDTINGGTGYDRIEGGAGDDSIEGDHNCDVLFGDSGVDQVYGDSGDDDLWDPDGGALFGDSGHDMVNGILDNDMPEACDPTIEDLTDDPDPVFVGHNLTLTAVDVWDFGSGVVMEVKFYRDANANGTLELGTDTYLGIDTDGSNGWTHTFAVDLQVGTYTYFAQAKDDYGNLGNWVSTTNEVKLPEVTINANDPNASEIGPATGQFTVTRTGPTTDDLDVYLNVNGSADSNDYTVSGHPNWPTYVTIDPGYSSVTITITPTTYGGVEPTETVFISIASGAAYTIGMDASDTVEIEDAVPTVWISSVDPTASEAGPSSGHFVIERTGTTVGALIVSIAMSGTATNGMDYQSVGAFATIDNGYSSKTVYINPYSDIMPEATETAVLTIQTSAFYYRGSPYTDTVSITNSGALMLAVPPAEDAVEESPPTMTDVLPLVDEAITRWVAAGADPARLRALLAGLQVRVLDMPDEHLARIVPGYLLIDANAAGHGWYIDATPGDDAEFATLVGDTERSATAGAALGRADLLTVLTHEIGHLLDHDDLDHDEHPHDLMAEVLPLSTRRLPAAGQGAHELDNKVEFDAAHLALQRMIAAHSLVVMLGQEGSFWQAAGIDAATLTAVEEGAASIFAAYVRGLEALGPTEEPGAEEPGASAPPLTEGLDIASYEQAVLDAQTERVWEAVDDWLSDLSGFNPLAGTLGVAVIDALFAEFGAAA